MKRAIMVAALALTPMTASAWDNNFYDDQAQYEQAAALREIAAEMRYQQEYREYEQKVDNWNQYNERTFGGEGSKMGPYYQPPVPPKR